MGGLGCVVSRSIGPPGATDDMGNRPEALGLASLFIDGVVVLLGVSAFTEGRGLFERPDAAGGGRHGVGRRLAGGIQVQMRTE
ncbi:hypothetical protein [Streptomyces sp. NPDC002671]